MKERPILFQGAMVRAILAGTKTQTRRVVKLTSNGHVKEPRGHRRWHPADPNGALACPYGQPGDRLWVREAWRVGVKWDSTKPSDLQPRGMTIEFEAGGYGCNGIGGGWAFHDAPVRERPVWVGKLRPGMFMPRWASRITLEVTGVRVERLQDISEADAIAEGIERAPSMGKPGAFQWCDYRLPRDPSEWFNDPVRSYQSLWEQINGPEIWAANPWVWVVEFKRLEQPA